MGSKVQSLILVVLIAIITMIFNVSADANQYTSGINPEISYPPLKFNSSQTKLIVTGDLSPTHSTSYVQYSLMTASQKPEKRTIPFGAIIHHSNNITTIFDDNGSQLFVADDKQSETIHTFRGDSPATFIHLVPNNSIIIDDGNILHVVNNNSRILTIIDEIPINHIRPGFQRPVMAAHIITSGLKALKLRQVRHPYLNFQLIGMYLNHLPLIVQHQLVYG
jgi:hypothetical protein